MGVNDWFSAVPPEVNRGALLRLHSFEEREKTHQPNSEQGGPRSGDWMLSKRCKNANRLMAPIGEYRESFNLKGPKTFDQWEKIVVAAAADGTHTT